MSATACGGAGLVAPCQHQVHSCLSAQLAREMDARTTLLVLADHGSVDRGGSGGAEPQATHVPLVAYRPGSNLGSDARFSAAPRFHNDPASMADVAVTLSALLGLVPRAPMLEPPTSIGAPPLRLRLASGPVSDAARAARRRGCLHRRTPAARQPAVATAALPRPLPPEAPPRAHAPGAPWRWRRRGSQCKRASSQQCPTFPGRPGGSGCFPCSQEATLASPKLHRPLGRLASGS